MPKSFDEFVADGGRSPYTTAAKFFAKHPGLEDQVVAARKAEWQWSDIFDWLVGEYGYPLKSATSVRKYLDGEGRGNV